MQAQADKAKSFFGGAMKAGVAAMRWRMHAQESADTEVHALYLSCTARDAQHCSTAML